MTKVVPIYEAKTNLSKLIKKAQSGETIYVGAYGQIQAVIAPPPAKQPLKLDLWKGKIPYSGDIVGSDPAVIKLFKGSRVMPDDSF